jgi:hypothetical protein
MKKPKFEKSVKQDVLVNEQGEPVISFTCTRCGKPLVKTGPDGMSCENDCFRAENKAARKMLKNMFGIDR